MDGLLRIIAVLFIKSMLSWRCHGEMISFCGPASVVDDMDNSSVVLLGGLFPVHEFEGHGRDRCGRKITKKGFQRSLGMVFAVEQVNNNASLLPGIKLAYDIRDTCTSSATALEESVSFLPDSSGQGKCLRETYSVSGVVGPSYGENCIPTQNLLRLFQIPQITNAGTAIELSDKTRYDYFFRTIPPDTLQVKAMSDLVSHFNWTYVNAVYSNDAYGLSGIEEFIKHFTSQNDSNYCIAQRIGISGNPSEGEIKEIVEKFRQPWVSNSSVIVFFGHSEHANAILNEWKNSTGLNHLIWVASDSAATSIDEVYYSQAHGMIGVEPSYEPNTDYDEWFKSLSLNNTAGSPWFEEYWKAIFNCNQSNCPEGLTFGNDSTYSQNSKVNFTMEAVLAFANALHQVHEDFCNGIPGLCEGMLQDGGRRIDGFLLREYLRNATLQLTGGSNVPLFNANQDRIGGYTIYNLKRMGEDSFRYEEIGTWDEHSLEVNSESMEWGPDSDGVPKSYCSLPCQSGQYRSTIPAHPCCWRCEECGVGQISDRIACEKCPETHKPSEDKSLCQEIEKTYLKWYDTWSLIIIILSLMGGLGTLVAIVFYIAFHRKQAIVAGNRIMSAVILVGILLGYLLPFAYLGQPTPVSCAFRRIGIALCFSICFGALLVKINRIYRVVNRVTLGQTLKKPRFINMKSQLLLVGIIVLIPLVIAGVWLALEHPIVKTVVLIRWEMVEVRCGVDPRIGLSVILVYNFLLLLGCVYFTIRTRKVPREYNEARFIHITVITVVIVWIAFIAFYYSTTGLQEIYIITAQVTSILITSTVLLLFLILHKMYSVLRKETDEHPSMIDTPSSALRRMSNARKTFDLSKMETAGGLDDLNNDEKVCNTEEGAEVIMSGSATCYEESRDDGLAGNFRNGSTKRPVIAASTEGDIVVFNNNSRNGGPKGEDEGAKIHGNKQETR